MRTERTDILVGITTIGAVAIVVAVMVWLAGAGQRDSYTLYAQFDDMTGITEQGGVFLRGYEIGRISDIQPVVDASGRPVFRVAMDVRWSLAGGEPRALPVGTTAVLKPPPFIGAAYIELVLPEQPVTERLEPGDMIAGVSEPPLVAQATQLSGSVVTELSHTLVEAREMMDSLTSTTAAAHQLMLASSTAVPVMMASIDRQLELAGAMMAELQTHAGTMTPALLAAVDSSQALLGESRALLRELTGVAAEAGPGVARILENLESTTLVLDHFTRMVAEQPTRMMRGIEVPDIGTLRMRAERRDSAGGVR